MAQNQIRFGSIHSPGSLDALRLASSAVAGPPLICHAFRRRKCKISAWISHDWKSDRRRKLRHK